MKKYLLLPVTLFIVFETGSLAQSLRTCGSPQHHDFLKATDPVYAANRIEMDKEVVQAPLQSRSSMIVTIPVVFHVIYANAAQNIPDARIFEQMDVLNDDFARTNANAVNTPSVFAPLGANTGIQFCLAQRDPNGNATTGIVRVSTSLSTVPTFPGSISAPWNTTQYLNIYVANYSGGILGIAQAPGGSSNSDYVCVLFSTIGGPNNPGTFPAYNLGRTATHEVGHWLNLIHIWGDDANLNNVCNTSECGGSDNVSDTPNQCDAHFGSPSFPQVTCNNGPNGDMFMNYMDYSDDAAMNIFTLGQSTRMNNAITQYRSSILTSLGCVPVSVHNSFLENSFVDVFPNPAKEQITLRYNFSVNADLVISINNTLGEVIKKQSISNTKEGDVKLDLSLPRGVYFAEFKTSEGTWVKKLMIQ